MAPSWVTPPSPLAASWMTVTGTLWWLNATDEMSTSHWTGTHSILGQMETLTTWTWTMRRVLKQRLLIISASKSTCWCQGKWLRWMRLLILKLFVHLPWNCIILIIILTCHISFLVNWPREVAKIINTYTSTFTLHVLSSTSSFLEAFFHCICFNIYRLIRVTTLSKEHIFELKNSSLSVLWAKDYFIDAIFMDASSELRRKNLHDTIFPSRDNWYSIGRCWSMLGEEWTVEADRKKEQCRSVWAFFH